MEPTDGKRIPNSIHEAGPWRIREIAPDFTIEDVWALPAHGKAGDFKSVPKLLSASDPSKADSGAARFLWQLRDRLGKWFGIGRISKPAGEGGDQGLTIPGTHERSLRERLPEDLRDTASGVDFGSLPFTPLYLADSEFAAEVSNQTVHGVMHLAWVDQGAGRYQGQMAVYVKPRGLVGKGYMALIKPFRYLVVYPALMRQVERTWNAR